MIPRLSLFVFAGACLVGSAACKKGGSAGGGSKSDRADWIESPTTGKTTGNIIAISDLGVSQEIPETLYKLKSCQEASHKPNAQFPDWVPVLFCESVTAEDGGYDEDDSDAVRMTFYVTPKNISINERTVEAIKTNLRSEGLQVDNAVYIDNYAKKKGRTGIEVLFHSVDSDGYADMETKRFIFPRGDVLFVADMQYPAQKDHSGADKDWERIMWGFQFDEDGPLYDY